MAAFNPNKMKLECNISYLDGTILIKSIQIPMYGTTSCTRVNVKDKSNDIDFFIYIDFKRNIKSVRPEFEVVADPDTGVLNLIYTNFINNLDAKFNMMCTEKVQIMELDESYGLFIDSSIIFSGDSKNSSILTINFYTKPIH